MDTSVVITTHLVAVDELIVVFGDFAYAGLFEEVVTLVHLDAEA